MGQPFKFDLLDLSGGHVDGIPPTHIQDKEFANLTNFRTYGAKIIKRAGVKAITGAPYSQVLTSLFQYKDPAGTLYTMVGSANGFGFVNGTIVSGIPTVGGAVLGGSSVNGHWRQYINSAYFVRKHSALWRGTPAFMQNAGIEGPTVAPTVADTVGTDIEVGTYQCVYRFVNTLTGAKSKWSPVNAVATSGGFQQITWSNLQLSANVQVNGRELLRTLPNQQGAFYRSVLVGNNTVTSYVDITAQDSLGDLADDDNDLPPTNLSSMELWDERLWVTDEVELFYSALGLPESFPLSNFVDVYPDDGHKIRALAAWADKLMIGKTNGIHYITKVSDAYALRTLDDKVGCLSPHSMKASMGRLIWFGTGKQFFASTGGPAAPLGSYKIRTILDDIPDGDVEKVVAIFDPEHDLYLAIVPQSSGAWKVLGYNYRNDNWQVFTHPQNISFLATVADANFVQQLLAVTSDTYVYQYMTPNHFLDFGEKYWATFDTKAFDGGRPDTLLAMRRAALLCSKLGHADGECIITPLRDGAPMTTRAKNISLWQPYLWKRYNAGNLFQPGTTVGLRFAFLDSQELEITGISLEGVLLDRLVTPV